MDARDYMGGGRGYKAADIKDAGSVRHTITAIRTRTFDDGSRKPEFSFDGTDRTLIAIPTNIADLADRLGYDMGGWIGAEIELVVRRVNGPSGMTDGIRIGDVKAAEPVPGWDGADTALPTNGNGPVAEAAGPKFK